ncbi:MAG: 3-methyl-2-oxobutanoate hydroxymethyltransferase [Candidatus Delongbacteria bacterium]|jgi:3-methyl-2-oxobutanoate hydroxymethyltransferase|nr:3-methyl-2-oxobutanoate hydroxymethyltransferase [Candidatus Delongbacteria bacterium]
MAKRKTVKEIYKMKKQKKKITMLTAYDYQFAKIMDKAGIDVILVGDSLGMVFQGNSTTIPVTVEQMIYHTKIVVDSTENAFIIADMPFGSYQISVVKGVENAVKMMKETGCNAVKIEGGQRVIPLVKQLILAGIPVFGHLGLTPQSINKFGSYRLRARKEGEAYKLINDAVLLEKAGVSGIILEKIPSDLAEEVTKKMKVPTIGIGAGSECDGQVLVITDLLGIDEDVNFKFVRKYANLNEIISNSVENYISDVKDAKFPSEEESY